MPNYNNGIIYKIECKDKNIIDVYYGSTTNFVMRKKCHKYCCNNIASKSYNTILYKYIRESGGWDNWEIKKIKDYPCN